MKPYWIGIAVVIMIVLVACAAPATQTPAPVGSPGGSTTGEPTSTTAAGGTPIATSEAPKTSGTGARTLTVMTHDSFSVSEDVVAAFKSACDCDVRFLKSGDTGLALNKAILSKGSPLADVFYGVDNTFMSRALKAGIFEPYESPALAGIPAELRLDPTNQLLPVDVGYVALNYDRAYFADKGIALPEDLQALTDPTYKDLLVVENPATSSPGLAFLAATVQHFGETGDYTYLDFWRDLKANGVLVSEGWEDAYYSQFSGGSGGGERPIVVSYATSPAAEVFFADPQPAESPTANLFLPGSTFRQTEFVGILKGAKQPDLARQWVDFMLGEAFQADIPLQMWVYPARNGTPLPEVFANHAQAPGNVTTMTAEQIGAGREGWIKAWTDAVLR